MHATSTVWHRRGRAFGPYPGHRMAAGTSVYGHFALHGVVPQKANYPLPRSDGWRHYSDHCLRAWMDVDVLDSHLDGLCLDGD